MPAMPTLTPCGDVMLETSHVVGELQSLGIRGDGREVSKFLGAEIGG